MRIITLFVVALMLLASNLLAADYLTPASAESVPEDQPSALPVLPPFSLPGGGARNYEHMSRGWWPLDDYGTNPTHEPTENR